MGTQTNRSPLVEYIQCFHIRTVILLFRREARRTGHINYCHTCCQLQWIIYFHIRVRGWQYFRVFHLFSFSTWIILRTRIAFILLSAFMCTKAYQVHELLRENAMPYKELNYCLCNVAGYAQWMVEILPYKMSVRVMAVTSALPRTLSALGNLQSHCSKSMVRILLYSLNFLKQELLKKFLTEKCLANLVQP